MRLIQVILIALRFQRNSQIRQYILVWRRSWLGRISEYDECIRHIPQNEDNEVLSIFVLATIVNHVC